MRIARHVVARKTQQLVALPAEVRRHLGLVPGAMVWWHIGRRKVVSLTTTGRTRAGRPTLDEDCPTCAKLRAELERLRREMRDGTAATPGQHWREGYHRALGDLGNFKADIQVALMLLKQLVRRDRDPGAPRLSRPSRPRRRVETVPGPDQLPPPDSPSSPVPIEQGADTSGRQPQVSHSDA